MTVKDVTSAPSMLARVKLNAGACSTSVGVLPSFPMMPCACTHTTSMLVVVDQPVRMLRLPRHAPILLLMTGP